MDFDFGTPAVAQERPRMSNRPFPHMYDPMPVKQFKKKAGAMAKEKMNEFNLEPFDGALEVRLTIYRPIQKSVSKIEHQRRRMGLSLPVVKPDTDNYIKSFLDACNGVIWADDAQITDLFTKKRYADHLRIELEVLKLQQIK